MLKTGADRSQCVGVFVVEELESALGKHQTEAEGGIGWILLENLNFDLKFTALEQISQIQSGRSGPDDCDSHRHSFQVPLRSLLSASAVTVVSPVGSERLAMTSAGTGWALIAPAR